MEGKTMNTTDKAIDLAIDLIVQLENRIAELEAGLKEIAAFSDNSVLWDKAEAMNSIARRVLERDA
jgi:hypothetical protein